MPDLPLELLRRGVSAGFGDQTGQALELTGLQIEALPSTGGGSFSTSVERISFVDPVAPWSVILKRMAAGAEGWDREADAHQDLEWFASALPDGLQIPRLFAIDRSPEEVGLVFEDLGPSASLDESDLTNSARLLADFSARPATPRPWWSSDVLTTEFHTLADRPEHLTSTRSNVGIERLRGQLVEILRDAPNLLNLAHQTPRGPAHLDAYSRNLIVDRTNPRIGLVDWASAGSAPIGTDPATLFALTLGYLDVETNSVADLEVSMVDAMLDGLVEGGATVAADTAAASFRAIAKLRHLAMMMNALPMVEANNPAVSAIVGRPLDEIVDRWILLGEHFMN